MRIAAALGMLMWAATAAAEPSTVEERFHQATAAMVANRHAEAAAAFEAIARDAPDDRFADDALFSAAQLYEERLGKPGRAADLYQQLLERYPDSRTSLAASRRLESLRRDLGPDRSGARALAIFNDILQRYPERSEAESMRRMTELLAKHPDWAGAPRATAWLGSAHERAGRWRQAIDRYLEVTRRWPGTEHARDAYRGAGESALKMGAFDEAEGYFTAMRNPTDPARERTYHDAMRRIDTARLRARLYVAAQITVLAALLLLAGSLRQVAGSWRRASVALLPAPTEIIYMLPIAALLSALAFTSHYAVAPAVVIICSGGLLITWLSGAALRADRRRARGRLAAHALVSFAAVLAIAYIALHRQQLLDMLIETVRFGPDV